MKVIVPPEKYDKLERGHRYSKFVESEKNIAALASIPPDKLIRAKKPEEDKDRMWHVEDENKVLHVLIKNGQKVFAEAGSMLYMGEKVETYVEKVPVTEQIGRFLFQPYVSYYTGEGEVAFAGCLPGELAALQLEPGESVLANPSAWFAGIGNFGIFVLYTLTMGRSIIGVDSLHLRRFENKGPGDGTMFFFACSGYELLELKKEETVIVEVDSAVAWEQTVNHQLKQSNIKSGFWSGESLITLHLTGPGLVILQTANVSKLQNVIGESMCVAPPPIMAMTLAFRGVKKGYRKIVRGR